MRIVFQCYGDPQVSFGGEYYKGSCQHPPEWTGMQIDGVLCFVPREGSIRKEEAIYIEGDLEDIRKAFEYSLDQLAMIERWQRERFDEVAARTVACKKCGYFYDSMFAKRPHGDGKGNPCVDD